MNADEYQRRAMAKEADQAEIRDWVYQQGTKATRLTNACRGLADDCGELNGAAKKWLEYQQPLDEVNVLEEIGDCLWRLAQACEAIEKTLGDAMSANLRKLEEVRYKDTVCNPIDAAELNRNRQAEREALTEPLDEDMYRGHLCPNCKTPVSDELIRRVNFKIGNISAGVCPECRKLFYVQTSDNVLSLKSVEE